METEQTGKSMRQLIREQEEQDESFHQFLEELARDLGSEERAYSTMMTALAMQEMTISGGSRPLSEEEQLTALHHAVSNIRSQRQIIVPRMADTLAASYSPKELREEAKKLGLTPEGPGKDVARQISRKLRSREEVQKNFLSVPDESIAAFEQAMRKPFIPSQEELFLFAALNPHYIAISQTDQILVPEDVKEAWKEAADEAFMTLRKKVSWMFSCLSFLNYTMCMAPESVLAELYGTKYDQAEAMDIFHAIPDQYLQYADQKGMIADRSLSPKMRKLMEERPDLEYAHPGRSEIEQTSRDGYPSSEPSYQALRMFFMTNLPKEDPSSLLHETWYYLALGDASQALNGIRGGHGIQLGEGQQDQFLHLLSQANAHTRKISLKGNYLNPSAKES